MKRIAGLLVLALFLTASMSYAGGKKEEAASGAAKGAAVKPGTYNVMVGGEKAQDYLDPVSGATMKGWETICKPFTDANPGAVLKFVEVPWSSYSVKLATGMESGEYDVVHLAAGQCNTQGFNGNLLPMENFLPKDPAFLPEKTFGASFWNSTILSLGGKHYGMPKSGYTFTHIVDTKLFRDAGVPLPPDNATYEQLYAAAKAIHGKKNANGDAIFGGYEYSAYETFRSQMQIRTGRVDWMAKWAAPEFLGGDLSKLQWDLKNLTPQIVETVAAMREFGKLMPPGWNNKQGAENFFTDKNTIAIYMNTDSGGKFKMLYDAKKTDVLGRYKVYAYPTAEIDGKQQLVVAGNVHTWGIPKSAKNPDVSYAISKFLSSAAVAKQVYEAQWVAPVVPEGISFLNAADPLSKISMAALQQAHGMERYSALSVWGQMQPMVRDNIMFKGILDGSADIKPEIEKVQKYLDDWLASAIKSGTR